MPDVEFDENQELSGLPRFTSRTALSERRASAMARWLLKKGIVKNESQAERVLLGIAVFNVALTFYVLYKFL